MTQRHPSFFFCVPRALVLAGAALSFATLSAAAPPDGNDPPQAHQRAHTLKPPAQDGRVVGGVRRGTDAAGRGIDRAEDATRRGINRGAEAASAPIRRVGEAFGRKLAPGTSGRPTPPATGPQGNGP